ncbi:MAG: hypothetical protein AB7G11_14960 [Phycisphaerales bacterium]
MIRRERHHRFKRSGRPGLDRGEFRIVLVMAVALAVVTVAVAFGSSEARGAVVMEGGADGRPVFRDYFSEGGSAADSVAGRAPMVRVELDRTEMTYAQRLRVRLMVVARPGSRIEWPALGASLGEFRVANVTGAEAAPLPASMDVPGGLLMVATQRVLTLEPTIAESHDVPALEFVVSGAGGGGGPATVRSEPIAVEVRSVLPAGAGDSITPGTPGGAVGGVDPGAMRGIAAVAPDRSLRPVVIASVGVVVAGGVVAASLVVAKRRRAPRSVPADVEARRRIGALFKGDGMLAAQGERAMSGLDAALREFVISACGLRPDDRTTAAIGGQLAERPGIPREEIERVLEQFDVAKFAGLGVHDGDVVKARKDVEAIISMVSAAATPASRGEGGA